MIREKLKIYESPSVDPDWDDDPFTNLERITSRRAFPFTVDEDPTGSERTSVRRVINEVLLQLKPREERVLRLRFGLGPGERHAHTLDEVGEQFGVSRERIRQIELKAFRQLKHPSRRRKLSKAYFGQSELTARERASVSFVPEPPEPPAQPPKEGYLVHKDDIDVQRRIASARKANRILREKRERIKSDEAYKEMVDDLTKAWKEI